MKPTPQRRQSESITPELIESYRTWEIGAAAAVLCRRYREIIKTKTELFVEMGLLLVEIERRELWKYDSPILDEPDFHSFDDWVKRASGTSNGTARDALNSAKGLSHMPLEERNEIPRCNQVVLAKLSPKVSSDPEVKRIAKKGSNDDLRRHIEDKHPEQHLESVRPMRFSPEKSARAVIDQALEMCMEMEGCGRDEALEKVCQIYIDEMMLDYASYKQKERGQETRVQ